MTVRVLSLALFSSLFVFPASSPADTASPPDAPKPSSSILSKPSAPAPREFTLTDRWFDAAQRGDVAALQVCLDKGIDANVKDEVGRSAFALAVRDGHSLPAAEFIAAHGVPTDEADAMGRTPLHEASGAGDTAIVAWLLAHGSKVDRKDMQGRVPLHNAVLGGSRQVVAALLQAGADVNARDNFQETPLMHACSKGLDEIAKLLVEKGADTSARDQDGVKVGERVVDTTEYCRHLPAAKLAGSK